MSDVRRIGIVGGGLTGSLLAANLACLPAFAAGHLQVTVIERHGRIGRGIAYSTPYDCHVLNVRAGNMGAWSDAAGDFAKFLGSPSSSGPQAPSKPLAHDDMFASRATYGDYLDGIIATAMARGVRHVRDAGQGVRIGAEGTVLLLKSGGRVQLDRVALCMGHLLPRLPRVPGVEQLSAPRCLLNPWDWRCLGELAADADVIVVGSGLTAVDTMLALWSQGHRGAITVVSRHGLWPKAHAPHPPAEVAAGPAVAPGMSPRAIVRALRRAAQDSGGNWQLCIDSMRASTSALWQGLDGRHRRQVLRHAKSFWDVHRHRIAPHVHAQLQQQHSKGQWRVLAGRLVAVAQDADGVQVTLCRRRDGRHVHLVAPHLINCTGGHNDWRHSDVPLIADLQAHGLAVADGLGLGVRAAPDGALIGADGRPSDRLFVGGPALVGRDFESVAVPELRVQAARLARRLAAA